jgi:transglutaminase-like putative cysteine protease
VVLLPHRLNLSPQQRPFFKVLEQSMTIDHDDFTVHELIDEEGNLCKSVYFNGSTKHLHIRSKLSISTNVYNPFDFVLTDDIDLIDNKFVYNEQLRPLLAPYLSAKSLKTSWFNTELSSPLKDISDLCREVSKTFEHIIRKEKGIYSHAELIDEGKGSCRDISSFAMIELKEMGFACRYVSGYAYNDELNEGHDLHAWVEVFLPGAGWLGVDPVTGLFTDHRYFPLHCSYDPFKTLPVIGTFGGSAKTLFSAQVDITI